MLNIGSCGFYVIYNFFRDGCFVVEWEVEIFFLSVRWFFKDFFVRREDYISVIGFICFLLDFCRYCWLENVFVVERVFEIIFFVV